LNKTKKQFVEPNIRQVPLVGSYQKFG